METKGDLMRKFSELVEKIEASGVVTLQTVAPLVADVLTGEDGETVNSLVWCAFQSPIFTREWTHAVDSDGCAWPFSQYLAVLILGQFFFGIRVPKLERIKGADVHADGDCALRCAASNGHAQIVDALLNAGANPVAAASVLWISDELKAKLLAMVKV